MYHVIISPDEGGYDEDVTDNSARSQATQPYQIEHCVLHLVGNLRASLHLPTQEVLYWAIKKEIPFGRVN